MRVESERLAVPDDSKRTRFGTVPQRLNLTSLEEVRGLNGAFHRKPASEVSGCWLPGASSIAFLRQRWRCPRHDLQPKVLHTRQTITITEQQRQVGLDAGGGDDPVDRLADCDAAAP